MKYLFHILLITLFAAAVAAWLKMLFPQLSLGYLPLWKEQGVRNIVGLLIAMPLYELLYLGYAYLLSAMIYVIIFCKARLNKRNVSISLLLGVLVSSAMYVLYQVASYLKAARLYAALNEHESKPWFLWVNYPKDLELLAIYSLAGLSGGWLYYKLITKRGASINT